jgi:hypothetical protein
MPVAYGAKSQPNKDYLDRYEDLTGQSLRQCPQCLRGTMVVVQILPRSRVKSPAVIDTS